MTKEKLENYEPKGELKGFPKEVIARMLDYQEEQGNPRNVTVFEEKISADIKGFEWDRTKEGWYFWGDVINNKNFNHFFEKYPKKDNQYSSQEFKVGDKVIDIIRGKRGKVTCIETLNKDSYSIFVDFDDNETASYSIFVDFDDNETASFTLDGRYYSIDKYPRLLHYRDDYDYSVIDFNNLPQRQEVNRWRAEVGERYYYLDIYFEVHSFLEEIGRASCRERV